MKIALIESKINIREELIGNIPSCDIYNNERELLNSKVNYDYVIANVDIDFEQKISTLRVIKEFIDSQIICFNQFTLCPYQINTCEKICDYRTSNLDTFFDLKFVA